MFMRPLYPTLYQNHSCHDTSHIASFFMRIMNGCRRIEAILSVALALERFQAVFALKKLRYLVDILTLLAWTYGSANIALLNSPLADFTVVPETFGPVYNKSLPWTEVIEKANLFSSITASLITFVFYVIIICQLVRQKFVIKTLKIEVHEKSILVQAFVRFFGDTTMTVFYHIVPLFLPHSKLLEIVTTLGYLINNLVLPPVLSVIVSRTLRTDVFLFMLKVSTVQPS
ncbi:hypothetical protein QR680_010028 [Steinernema hermaphroditum]|uniref:7TM GPCR serpentine receptor class x (Srx) domain-containing protein n=1 Tax=Steinernema hermaphroditum TaxID=289476 RepID=A0AA39IPX0_9BILA|nr:hypothetical protein QR680_010028 [Steinernema hermaphroditum]